MKAERYGSGRGVIKSAIPAFPLFVADIPDIFFLKQRTYNFETEASIPHIQVS
jgi:hypothetical protein